MAGTGSITSSVTSTSQTISHDPSTHNSIMAAALTSPTGAPSTINNPIVASFLSALADESNRHVFLQPPSTLPAGSLLLAKETLDALASQVSDHQQAKLKEIAATIGGKKRKREAGYDKNAVLKIRKLHVDEGFETEQIWQQAKKIIASAVKEAGDVLKELEENGIVGTGEEQDKTIEFGEDGFELDSNEDEEDGDDESGSGSEGEDEDDDDDEELEGSEGSGIDDDEEVEIDGEEVVFSDEDGEGEFDEEDEDEEDEEEEEEEEAPELVEDPNGLNDGFFSIDDFNRQTQLWEDADARADPNVDADSDDEQLDWHADPFATKPKSNKGKTDKKKEEDKDESDVDMGDESEDDEALEAAAAAHAKKLKGKKNVEQLEDDGDDLGLTDGVLGMDMDLTANDIYYKDFFAPPQQKKKTGNQRKGGYFPKRKLEVPDEADMERAENDVRRDLFDDLSENEDDEDKLSDLDAGDPRSRRSAHERRQAKIAEEIRRLESELVAKRAWTLSGEASAQARPMNSLLEEDLEFEHVGKPVPVITEEVSETIEALIKRRILANEFDEVLRRRPDTLGNPNNARRGLVEIDDAKGKQSLAEIYEEEHVKKAHGDEYVSASDEKLTRDEAEIKTMWKDICAKLDALSSWHYKPKPAAPTISVVTDVATVAMEDAMPTTAQGVTGGESTLAPQEVYAPGKDKDSVEKGEVVAKSGLPIAKEEMSREEKARRRRREKERIRKAGGLDATKNMSKGAQDRKDTMSQLKKGGVKVINRKGETVGLDGKKVAEQKGPTSSGAFKL
ncbi:Mpp10 protein-domain-containing protein [Sordaria sp. MPI-SDFR-AT-0083]|nr:Mpp10 protein-domain-containing protein [Sordaria sp. MPI-SDFR-AT-0083]